MSVQKPGDGSFYSDGCLKSFPKAYCPEHGSLGPAEARNLVTILVEGIKEDGSDMAFTRDTQKVYERLRELYGL